MQVDSKIVKEIKDLLKNQKTDIDSVMNHFNNRQDS